MEERVEEKKGREGSRGARRACTNVSGKWRKNEEGNVRSESQKVGETYESGS